MLSLLLSIDMADRVSCWRSSDCLRADCPNQHAVSSGMITKEMADCRLCALTCGSGTLCELLSLFIRLTQTNIGQESAQRGLHQWWRRAASCLSFINKPRLPSKTLTLTLSEYNNGLHTAPPAPAASGGIQAEADSVEDSGLSLLS